MKKFDIPIGGDDRWLTVVAPNDLDGTELLLEPDGYPGVAVLKTSLTTDGIPATSFAVDDIEAETPGCSPAAWSSPRCRPSRAR